MSRKSCKRFFFNMQKMFLYLFTFCEMFLFIMLICQCFVKSDNAENSTEYESEINYTLYNAFLNDSDENISMLNQNMNDSDFNKSTLSNVSVDVATELDSTISVTEDSDNSFQSETNRELFLFLTPDEDICNCDLSLNVCDINCCCDLDCSEEDIQVFSECSHQILTPDESYCYQKDIILRNNTVYKMVKNPNNAMFCIVHDNIKHHLRFKDMPVLKSHRDVITVLKYKYKDTYSWDTEAENIYDSREPRAGNPIYIDIFNKKIINRPWSLPSACLSDLCSCHEEIRFLNPFRSSCSRVIRDLASECESSEILSGHEFANFCISQYSGASLTSWILHAKKVNSSSAEDDENYSSAPGRICCEERNPKKPTRRSNECRNVVKHIHFTVEQDGANGITRVFADFQHINISFGPRTLLTQSYSVDFVWSNVTEFETKSGNPGYQMGLPVLAATNGSDADSEELFYDGGLSILGSSCDQNRQTVRFGINLKSGCFLKHDLTDCKSLQARVSDILLGPNKRQVFVGIFGNANASNPNEWLEAFNDAEVPEDGSECLVSLGLKIHIIYAAVGTVVNPQYKIVGVRYLHTKREAVDVTCAPFCKRIALSTSVSFFDVTLPAVEHYAKVPSIKANLPSDFFYPFMYGRSAKNTCNIFLLSILLLLGLSR